VRRILLYTAAGLVSGLCYLSATASELQSSGPTGVVAVKKVVTRPAEVCTDGSCSDGKFGTSVEFLKTPSEAARLALKEEKLVFVLHVSGLFENPDFT
jgi:hypothetical protein